MRKVDRSTAARVALVPPSMTDSPTLTALAAKLGLTIEPGTFAPTEEPKAKPRARRKKKGIDWSRPVVWVKHNDPDMVGRIASVVIPDGAHAIPDFLKANVSAVCDHLWMASDGTHAWLHGGDSSDEHDRDHWQKFRVANVPDDALNNDAGIDWTKPLRMDRERVRKVRLLFNDGSTGNAYDDGARWSCDGYWMKPDGSHVWGNSPVARNT